MVTDCGIDLLPDGGWQLEQWNVPQAVGIVAVLVAGGDHQQAEAQHVGEAPGQAEAILDLTQRQQAAIG